MRFHVLSLPHTQTTAAYLACAYTQKVVKFCRMMKSLGHTVFLYAGSENEAECDELIPCVEHMYLPEEYLSVPFDVSAPHWVEMNRRVIEALGPRLQPQDFICVIAGSCQKPIADAFPNHMTVEFGIGYSGVFANYRVFESYFWMAAIYGQQYGAAQADGRFYDSVIPNYFDPEDFPFSAEKDDYFLFVGRMIERKGVQVAVEVCRQLRARLILAGPGTPPNYGEHVGTVGKEARGRLMSRARAVFVPTLYLEPFGGVSIEALFCGTPIITTDWGAFAENNLHGITGYRCRTLEQFIWAAQHVESIAPAACRAWAMNFSTERIRWMYQEYFEQLQGLWGAGWYAERERSGFDWLTRQYPHGQ